MPKSRRELRKMLNFRDTYAASTLDKRIAVTAAKTVALNAVDNQEALQLLDMLGLIAPLPGNEPHAGEKLRMAEKTAMRAEERRLDRENRKKNQSVQAKRLKAIGATPDEYGEGEEDNP